jgi:DNA uptake protein ComE-like DNA-binding protein
MTVTQATRVIAYRDRSGGFDQVDDMDAVPGFPKDFLETLKERFSA